MRTKKLLSIILAAAMLLSFAACSGSTAKIDAQLSEVYEDGGLKTYYLNNPESFMAVAQNEIKMSQEDAQSFLQNEDIWQIYSLDILITNKGENAFTFVSFNEIPVEQSGIYFSTCPVNGELSVPGGVENEPYPATIIINTEKVSIEQMYSTVSEFEIVLTGYPTPAEGEDEDDIDPADYQKIAVKNNITAPEDEGTDTSKDIYAKRSSITDGSAYLNIYRNNELIFANESKLYGMDSETAAQAMNKEGNWQCYILHIDVENKTDEDLTVYSILPENNGAAGVWVNGISQYGEFSMSAGAKEVLPVNVLVNPDALGGKTVEQAISDMVINLEYSKGTLMDENGNESIQIKKIAAVE